MKRKGIENLCLATIAVATEMKCPLKKHDLPHLQGVDRYGQCLLEAEEIGYVERFNPSGSGNRCFYECIAKFVEKSVEDTMALINNYMEEHETVLIKNEVS